MPWGGGSQCPPAWLGLLCLGLLPAGAQGQQPCQQQAVPARGALQLLPKEPPEEWVKIDWRMKLDAGRWQRILTVLRDGALQIPRSSFSGRVTFQQESLSLQLSPTSLADSGLYLVEIETPSGVVSALCFQVSVWEPVQQPLLESHILQWGQGWCNLSLLCSLPGASNTSYSWACTGEPAGGSGGAQLWLHLEVQAEAEGTVCHCNASNPVSWAVGSIHATAACRDAAPGLFSLHLHWAVAVCLTLVLSISIALGVLCCWRRKPQKNFPAGHNEQMLTVYEEVGRAHTSQALNGSSAAMESGTSIYTVITKAQLPTHPQDPQSSTIYATVQATRKPSSLRRKRLDPALVSTAYTEQVTESFRCPHSSLQPSPPASAGNYRS